MTRREDETEKVTPESDSLAALASVTPPRG